MGAIPPNPPAEMRRGRVRPTEPWPDPPEWSEEVNAEQAARALQVLANSGIEMNEDEVESLRVETETITGHEFERHDEVRETEAGIQYRRTTAIRRHRQRSVFPTFTAAIQAMTSAVRDLGAAMARVGSIFHKSEMRRLHEQIEELEAHVDAEAVEEAVDEAEGGTIRDRGLVEMGDEEREVRIRLRKTQETVIEKLQEALYEYGEHKDGCAVEQQEPCDCGFDEILTLATQKKTSECSTQPSNDSPDRLEAVDQDVVARAREIILGETEREDSPRLSLQGIRPDVDVRHATPEEVEARRSDAQHEAEIRRMRERGAQPTEAIDHEAVERHRTFMRERTVEALRDSSTLTPYRVNAPDQVHTGPRQIIRVSYLPIWSNWCEIYENCPVNATMMDLGFEHISHYEDGPIPYGSDTRVDLELAIGGAGAERVQISACVPKGARSYGGNMVIPAGEYFGGERLSIRMRNNFSQSVDFNVVVSFFTRRFLQHFSTASMDF